MRYIISQIILPDGDIHIKKIPCSVDANGRIKSKGDPEYYSNGTRVKSWEFDDQANEVFIELF